MMLPAFLTRWLDRRIAMVVRRELAAQTARPADPMGMLLNIPDAPTPFPPVGSTEP